MAHENKMPWIQGEGEDRCGLRRARRPVSGMTTAHSEPRTGGGAGAPHGGEDHVGSLSSLVASLGEGSYPSNAVRAGCGTRPLYRRARTDIIHCRGAVCSAAARSKCVAVPELRRPGRPTGPASQALAHGR